VSGEPAVVEVKYLVSEMRRLIVDAFPRSIEIRTSIDPDVHPVKGNVTQLHQVLLNLCVNARDAMPQGGVLRIEARNVVLEGHRTPWREHPVSGPCVALKVSDTGQGMTDTVLKHIFEPFFTTKPPSQGTGLGLSTVQGIVKAHQGFVEVSSTPGKGTEFQVFLPAAPAARLEPTPAIRTLVSAGQNEQILVVDDEIALLEMVRQTLESFHYRVLTARNGGEALAIFQQYRGEIHAVIIDMMMPVMDGPATIQALRKLEPGLKFIGVSGLGSEAELMKAGALKVPAFLKKPFATEELLTTLRQVLKGEAMRGTDNGS
jgi:CheY-like chemotaxis protein